MNDCERTLEEDLGYLEDGIRFAKHNEETEFSYLYSIEYEDKIKEWLDSEGYTYIIKKRSYMKKCNTDYVYVTWEN